MNILESDKLKIRILICLNKQEEAISLNSLKKQVRAINYRSVQRNCDFLNLTGLITIKKQRIADITYNMISISDNGRDMLERYDNISNLLT